MANRLLTRHEFFLLCFIATAILVGSAVVVWTERHSQIEIEKVPPPVAAAAEIPPPSEKTVSNDPPSRNVDSRRAGSLAVLDNIVVEVAGEVERPGIYRFAADATVADAIDKAGGITENADMADLNRAAVLVPGSRLIVPQGRSITVVDGRVIVTIPPRCDNIPAYTAGIVAKVAAKKNLVNINTADAAELETLPRIGPKIAAAIIKCRNTEPFARIEDIERVSGIGPKTMDQLRPLITVGDAHRP
ncbi:MAG: ComEA family DNA-binding protein [Candidatus Hydrogenedentes bacterium]|nr:ComEA family DNA-binding protein [Candidatus Hydrogenedentota bacterium]